MYLFCFHFFESGNSVKRYTLSSKEVQIDGETYFVPIVDKSVEPYENLEFDTMKKGCDMYKEYSIRGGFDSKLGSAKWVKGVLRYKSMFCSRQGESVKHNVDTLNGDKGVVKRKRASKRSKCAARICFKQIDQTGRFFVLKFVTIHNHELFTNATVHMSRQIRQLNFHDKSVIHNLTMSNIGATKAHAVMSGLKGGYQVEGPTYVDYKNWSRDLDCYIGDSDANMLVDLMNDRKKYVSNFYFEHICQENHLLGCFWADSTAKRNYEEFSDVISFDATYSTNK